MAARVLMRVECVCGEIIDLRSPGWHRCPACERHIGVLFRTTTPGSFLWRTMAFAFETAEEMEVNTCENPRGVRMSWTWDYDPHPGIVIFDGQSTIGGFILFEADGVRFRATGCRPTSVHVFVA